MHVFTAVVLKPTLCVCVCTRAMHVLCVCVCCPCQFLMHVFTRTHTNKQQTRRGAASEIDMDKEDVVWWHAIVH